MAEIIRKRFGMYYVMLQLYKSGTAPTQQQSILGVILRTVYNYIMNIYI